MILVEDIEQARQELALVASLDVRMLVRFHALLRGLRNDVLPTSPTSPAAPKGPGYAHADLSDPGPETGPTFEFAVAPIDDEEDLLRCVVQVGLGNPEITQRAPDRGGVSLEDLLKREPRELRVRLLLAGHVGSGTFASCAHEGLLRHPIHSIPHL